MIFQAEVLITPREGVLDTGQGSGENTDPPGIQGGQRGKGRQDSQDAAQCADSGRGRQDLESMCSDLLCNDLIETFNISVRK